MQMQKGIGHQIKVARVDAGLKQSELADLVNVSQNTVSAWEKGITSVSSTTLIRLSQVLHKPLEFFVPIQAPKNIPAERRKAA